MAQDFLELFATRPKIDYHISEACNLSCKGCKHGTPLTRMDSDPFVSLEEFEKDISKVVELLPNMSLVLLGGEPLLNPRITEYLYLSRSLCPTQYIFIITNGTLINRMDDAFFKGMKDNNIFMFISDYGMIDTHEVLDICHKHGVEPYIGETTLFHKYLNSEPSPDKVSIYRSCRLNNCAILHHGYLYYCGNSLLMDKVQDVYGVNTGYDIKSDRIYIHRDLSESDVQKIKIKMLTPHNICAYCRGGNHGIYVCEQKDPEVCDFID